MPPVISVQALRKDFRYPRQGKGVAAAVRGVFAPDYQTVRIAEEGDERLREVFVVGEHPERRSVSVNDDRLALSHAVDDGPAVIERQQSAIVGVRGPDDRVGELTLSIRLDEELLTSDFVSRILPIRVVQQCRLSYRQRRRRSLVRAGRGDKHKLSGPARKHVDVLLNVLRREGDPVDNRIELHVPDGGFHRRSIADVAIQNLCARWHSSVRLASVEQEQFDSGLHCERRTGRTDDACASDEQNAHGRFYLTNTLLDECLEFDLK